MRAFEVMLLCAAAVSAVLTCVLAALWRSQIAGVREWLAANVLVIISHVLFAIGWKYQPFLVLETANMAFCSGVVLLAGGYQRFFGKNPHYRIFIPLLALVFFVLYYFHYVTDHISSRIIAVSVFHALTAVMVLQTLLRTTRADAYTSAYSLTFARVLTSAIVAYLLLKIAAEMPFIATPTSRVETYVDGMSVVFLALGFLLLPALTTAGATLATSRLVLLAGQEARTDYLTGAWSRRALVEFAVSEINRAARTRRSLSLLVLDIDDFKQINDAYGHPVGDTVLVHLARQSMAAVRDIDYFSRLGGEEFAVLMPETNAREAAEAAERLRLVLGAAGPGGIRYTVSIGIAQFSPGQDWERLYKSADDALALAKREGKNRVVVAGMDDFPVTVLPPGLQPGGELAHDAGAGHAPSN
ncbi:MAG: hypothetical protein JWP36_309 [Paucimonas sp.]|nr:hypothetical protein [Paucimonas sp.]